MAEGKRRQKLDDMKNKKYQIIDQCWKQDQKEVIKIKDVGCHLQVTTIPENDEIKQLEEWTQMKYGNVIFDSNVDDWSINTSVFHLKILNKSNLIFLIEDGDGNKFGGYVNTKIDKTNGWIKDPKSFLFSLKSNGRLNEMLKFDIEQTKYTFYLYKKAYRFLFLFGKYDIFVYKENYKTESICVQKSFNYSRIVNALHEKEYFTPKRIKVIQLI